MTYINLTASRQYAAVVLTLISLLFLGYLGLRFQHFGHVVLSRNHALAEADRAVATLGQQSDSLRDSLAEAESRAEAVGEENDKLTARLAMAQRRIAALQSERDGALADAREQLNQLDSERSKALSEAQRRISLLDTERTHLQSDRTDVERKLANAQEKLTTKTSSLSAIAKELDRDRDLLRHSDSNQVALQTRIQALEKELAQANLHTDKYRSDLANIENKLSSLTAERDQLVVRRDDVRRHGTRTSRLPDNSSGRTALTKTDDRDDSGTALPALPKVSGGRIEAVIASTGLNVSKLLADVGGSSARAEGGPFVPFGDATRAGADARRHKMLEKLAETLPLRAPLDHYRVESPFGARRDPFNHRHGFHTGVDLSAAYRTHVFSTAPGIVIFSGADGEWGRLVEIDNGYGIVTRYAHLHRTLVVKGQKVPAHYAIGELGSTGRSTGPHVHYEVVVDGTAVDPAKFLNAGDNVIQVGAKQ